MHLHFRLSEKNHGGRLTSFEAQDLGYLQRVRGEQSSLFVLPWILAPSLFRHKVLSGLETKSAAALGQGFGYT